MSAQVDFFERLLLLPLFQGIGRGEFFEIAERIRIGFQKVAAGDVLVHQDSLCDRLLFILRGELCARHLSGNKHFVLSEWMDMPMVVQPEHLFGLRTRFTHSFHAVTDLQVLKIDKAAVRDILFYYPTFRINYLNMVSSQVQQTTRNLWKQWPVDLEARFVYFLMQRCSRPAGRKELKIKMSRLAEELLSTRLRVSDMLNALEERKLIVLHRERIEIPSFETLLMGGKR